MKRLLSNLKSLLKKIKIRRKLLMWKIQLNNKIKKKMNQKMVMLEKVKKNKKM
jgi:hypothetical protein